MYLIEEDDVPIAFLYGFSAANAGVDIICNRFFYYRGKELFYQELEEAFFTTVEPHTHIIGGVELDGRGTDLAHLEGVER